MPTSYSHESALQRAMEVYFNGKKGRDTDDFRTMLFLQTELKMVCLALTRAGAVRRQFAFYAGAPRKLRVKPKAGAGYRYPGF